ncbi:hypothetical protein ABTZ03_17370 [Kitasatospora sp. NPDC096077]|uniref:hypothetical protein n=1 Tax=Kitasatospora sp. NPDC096077 TaxID=3155544 RepID=UPI00331AA20D
MASSKDNPRLAEDMQLRLLEGGPVDYNYSTDKPVVYVSVAGGDGGVLGYLWASDADDAAGWVEHRAAGPAAAQAAGYWLMKMRSAKSRAVPPSQALEELSADADGGRAGQVVPASRRTAASLQELQDKGLEGWEPSPPQPEPPRGRRR